MKSTRRGIPLHEPDTRTFDEKMRDGGSLNDGLAGSMPMHEPWDKPYRPTHKPTRCMDDEDD